MTKRISFILIIVISVLVLFLIAGAILNSPNQENGMLPHVDNAESLYASAVSKTDLLKDTILTIQLTEEMEIDGTVFQETTQQIVYYDIQTSGSPKIQIHETRQSGTQDIEFTEIFINDVIYLTVNDTPFLSNCSFEQYEPSLIPAIVLSSNLYKSIDAFDTGSSYMITFSDANKPEGWLTDPSVNFLEARGVAHVGYDGKLTSSMYTSKYQKSGVEFRVTAEVSIKQEDVSVNAPNDAEIYTPISDWTAPKLLERACGYLLQARQISASYNDNIFFDAIGDRREKQVVVHADYDDEWAVAVSTEITTQNEAKIDQAQTHCKNEVFLAGQYQVSNDGESPVINTSITVDDMYNYFQDQLVSTVMLPQHIGSAQIIEDSNILHIVFTGTDAFGSYLAENASLLLYNDSNLITKFFVTMDLKSYIDIDRATYLPLASGIEFTGKHTAEGLPYSLSYSASQTYIIPNAKAMSEIEKAAD